MPDKKLTDNEIIKALKCCSEKVDYEGNEDTCCSCSLIQDNNCTCTLAKLSLDLINRLQAENESIRRKALLEAASKFAGHSDYHGDTVLCKLICMAEGKEVQNAKPLDISKIKAEAYKEFAERLKEKSGKLEMVCSGALVQRDYTISEKTLNNLFYELVGEDNA